MGSTAQPASTTDHPIATVRQDTRERPISARQDDDAPIVLDRKRERMAQLVVQGFSQTDAYAQAFEPTTTIRQSIREGACRVMAEPDVRARVGQLKLHAAQRSTDTFVVSHARVLAEIARIALADPRKLLDENGIPLRLADLPDDIAAALDAVQMQPDGTAQYRLARKAPALDMLAKHLGLYEQDNRQKADSLADALARLATDTSAPSARIAPADD